MCCVCRAMAEQNASLGPPYPSWTPSDFLLLFSPSSSPSLSPTSEREREEDAKEKAASVLLALSSSRPHRHLEYEMNRKPFFKARGPGEETHDTPLVLFSRKQTRRARKREAQRERETDVALLSMASLQQSLLHADAPCPRCVRTWLPFIRPSTSLCQSFFICPCLSLFLSMCLSACAFLSVSRHVYPSACQCVGGCSGVADLSPSL